VTGALLLELLVKSGGVAAAGLALSAFLSRRPAAERALVLRIAVCLLVALPVFLWVGPSLPLAWLTPPPSVEPASAASWSVSLQPMADASVAGQLPAGAPWALLIALAYAAGLLAVGARFLVGLWTLRRWTSQGRTVSAPAWTTPLRRLNADGRTRLIASAHVKTPLSWGLPPGVILIGEDCVSRAAAAEAVLAHELAHIRRGDWIFALLSRLALALFWFNPLVWLLHHSLSARTEEAADALAVAGMDRRLYARVLVDLASTAPFSSTGAALGIAGSHASLTKRISRIMTSPRKTPSRPLTLALSVGALLAVATPLAAIELIPRAAEAAAESVAWTPPAPPVPPTPPAPPAAPERPAQPAKSVQTTSSLIVENGRTIHLDMLEDGERRDIEAARAEARLAADAARRDAQDGRREAEAAARSSRDAIERVTRDAAAAAASARVAADAAREHARVAMIDARASMLRGADDMDQGAETMRANALRLRDPARRAEVIAENRARGNEVTHAQLIELSRTLPQQADDMVRSAQRMREQARSL